jgi:hypothetical protein
MFEVLVGFMQGAGIATVIVLTMATYSNWMFVRVGIIYALTTEDERDRLFLRKRT